MSNLEKAGRFLRLMGWINLVLFTGIIAAVAIPVLADGQPGELASLLLLTIVAVAIIVLYLSAGSAIKRGKRWGKVTGAAVATVSLINVPVGTVCGALTLFYLKKGWGEVNETTV